MIWTLLAVFLICLASERRDGDIRECRAREARLLRRWEEDEEEERRKERTKRRALTTGEQ